MRPPPSWRIATMRNADRSTALVPGEAVNVNVQNGIVQLRGEVQQPELIDELDRRVRAVQGVREVENLLHLPGTEARMHE